MRPLGVTINLTLPSPQLNQVPKHHTYTPFKYLHGWWLNHFSRQTVPMLYNCFLAEISNLNLPWYNLRPFSLIACYLREETDAHLPATYFQVVVESKKVSPEPSFLQGKHPQLPQPPLREFVLHTLYQLCCLSPDTPPWLSCSEEKYLSKVIVLV